MDVSHLLFIGIPADETAYPFDGKDNNSRKLWKMSGGTGDCDTEPSGRLTSQTPDTQNQFGILATDIVRFVLLLHST